MDNINNANPEWINFLANGHKPYFGGEIQISSGDLTRTGKVVNFEPNLGFPGSLKVEAMLPLAIGDEPRKELIDVSSSGVRSVSSLLDDDASLTILRLDDSIIQFWKP